MFRPLEAIIRSRSGYPKVGEEFGWQRCRKGSVISLLHTSSEFLCVFCVLFFCFVSDFSLLMFFYLYFYFNCDFICDFGFRFLWFLSLWFLISNRFLVFNF